MIKGSGVQKQKPHELLWMLWFDGKSISKEHWKAAAALQWYTQQ